MDLTILLGYLPIQNIYIAIVTYIITMETTIQISKELLENLKAMKIHEKESYENLIWDLIEDRMELSEETIKDIEESEKQIREGNTISLEEIKKKLEI